MLGRGRGVWERIGGRGPGRLGQLSRPEVTGLGQG